MQVEIQTVENLLDEVAYYSKEYADYSSLIQHKNPPRSLIYVNKRQLAGNCVQLNSQLEINGIKDIQQIDLIKTNKQGFKHEIINEKTNQPSIITAEPLPECELCNLRSSGLIVTVHIFISLCICTFVLFSYIMLSKNILSVKK